MGVLLGVYIIVMMIVGLYLTRPPEGIVYENQHYANRFLVVVYSPIILPILFGFNIAMEGFTRVGDWFDKIERKYFNKDK